MTDDHYDAVKDPLINPDTGVFYNLYNIDNAEELEATEAAAVAIRTYELRQNPLPGNFDLEHLQAIHRHLFQDVYPFAGKLRELEISKGTTRFAHRSHIHAQMQRITNELIADDHLLGLQPEAIATRCAYYMSEINALHPFREGNGRTQREFINHIVANCGLVVAWDSVPPATVLKCTIIAHGGSEEPLARLIADNLKPRK